MLYWNSKNLINKEIFRTETLSKMTKNFAAIAQCRLILITLQKYTAQLSTTALMLLSCAQSFLSRNVMALAMKKKKYFFVLFNRKSVDSLLSSFLVEFWIFPMIDREIFHCELFFFYYNNSWFSLLLWCQVLKGKKKKLYKVETFLLIIFFPTKYSNMSEIIKIECFFYQHQVDVTKFKVIKLKLHFDRNQLKWKWKHCYQCLLSWKQWN